MGPYAALLYRVDIVSRECKERTWGDRIRGLMHLVVTALLSCSRFSYVSKFIVYAHRSSAHCKRTKGNLYLATIQSQLEEPYHCQYVGLFLPLIPFPNPLRKLCNINAICTLVSWGLLAHANSRVTSPFICHLSDCRNIVMMLVIDTLFPVAGLNGLRFAYAYVLPYSLIMLIY